MAESSENSPIGHPSEPFTVLAAAPTAHVTVTDSVTGGAVLGAKLNAVDLVFSNGVAHAVVRRGQQNTLVWAVLGPPGSSYTIAVTQPSDADCDDGATLDKSGKGGGTCEFST